MLTPVQIKSYRFQSAGRGLYKSDEVDQFFEKVSASYEHIFKENSELVKRVSLLAEKIEEYRKDEELIKKTLIVAQRKADELESEATAASRKRIADADREANEKLTAAQTKATELLRSAEASASQQLAAAAGKAELLKMNAEEMAEARLAEAQAKVDAMLGGLQKEIAEEKEALKRIRYESKFFRKKLTDSYNEQLQRIGQILSFIDEEVPADEALAVQEPLLAAEPSKAPEIKPVFEAPKPAHEIPIEERLQAALKKEPAAPRPEASEPREEKIAEPVIIPATEPVIIPADELDEEQPVFEQSIPVRSAAAAQPASEPEAEAEPEPDEDDIGDVFIYGGDKTDDSGSYIPGVTIRSKSVDALVSKYGQAEDNQDGFDAAAEEYLSNSVDEAIDETLDDEDETDDGEGFRISLEQFVAEDDEKAPENKTETVESRLRRSFFGRRNDDEDEEDDDDYEDEDDEDEDDEDEYDDEDDDDDEDDERPHRFRGFFKK